MDLTKDMAAGGGIHCQPGETPAEAALRFNNLMRARGVKSVSASGVKYDAGKPRMDLLPPDALLAVATVLTYGAEKYGARNWEKGMAHGRLSAAAMRHLFAWQGGEENDPETGLPHLSHAACCLLMLLSSTKRGIGHDNRKIGDDV